MLVGVCVDVGVYLSIMYLNLPKYICPSVHPSRDKDRDVIGKDKELKKNEVKLTIGDCKWEYETI